MQVKSKLIIQSQTGLEKQLQQAVNENTTEINQKADFILQLQQEEIKELAVFLK
jgi:hypothetical protein